MSRFSHLNANKTFFVKKKQNIINIVNPEPIQPVEPVEPIIDNKPISDDDKPEPKLEETSNTIPILEDIYKDPEEPKEQINPIQIELKRQKSKQLFQLLVEQIVLNKKKEKIQGWNV